MPDPTPPGPIRWRLAKVRSLHVESATARTILLDVPRWPGHVAGQHLDVKLTAEDGYHAERAYSIASAPEEDGVAITVERLDDGEVSPYLADELIAGDAIEVRGPIGRPFTWRASDGGPLLLVAGGSGLVPLRAMLRHRAAVGARAVDARLLVSTRRRADLLYAEELAALGADDGVAVHHTLTRESPPGWPGFTGRVDGAMLDAVSPPPAARPHVYVCGPTAFVEHVADLLVARGHDPAAIRTERFGPTG